MFGIEEGTEIQTKGIENILSEMLPEKFPNLGETMDIQVKGAIRTPNQHDQKRTSPHHIIVKMPRVENKEY
jgi:hypothetical protein